MIKNTEERSFDRWVSFNEHTWPYSIFKQHDSELMLMWGTHISSAAFTYSTLKKNSAQWSDSPSKHFNASIKAASLLGNLKEWSQAFNDFENWVNLTVLLTLASNLETYMASVVQLALKSDPAVLIGATRSLDGAFVLKHGKPESIQSQEVITGVTKGDWNARVATIERIFDVCPSFIKAELGKLESLRNIRNRFGHAFGRDIEEARKTGNVRKLPIERVTRKKVEELRGITIGVAKELDSFLIQNHIGDFEALNFYHELYPHLHKHVNQGQHAQDFKKAIGRYGVGPRGKRYCKGLVAYWESL